MKQKKREVFGRKTERLKERGGREEKKNFERLIDLDRDWRLREIETERERGREKLREIENNREESLVETRKEKAVNCL